MSHPRNRYTLAAYAAAPSKGAWNEKLESEYFAGLRDEEFIEGIQLQFKGAVHEHPQWLRSNLRPDWSFVITTIGGVFEELRRNPETGLASTNPAARREALAFVGKARDAARQLNDWAGRSVVRAVEVYSAPRPTGNIAAATEALRQSLDELRSWQWDGARLAVEHCDALVPGRTPEKGYLPLDAEIQAVRASRGDTPLGMSINWGRSAIDERDAHAPLRHLKALKASSLLDGLMFSGATTDDPDYGDWADRHAPFDDPGKKSYLLTAERLKECLREVADTPLTYLGLKVQFLPNVLSATERVAALRRHAALLDAARAA